MTQTDIAPHAFFGRVIRGFDVLQRVYMRFSAYLSPTRDCRTVFGSLMQCHTRQFLQRRIRFFGVFEHNLTYYTLGKLREGDCYVDIGANIGYFTLLAASRVGRTGSVIAIEADPTTFEELTSNIKLNSYTNIAARNVAATETNCKVVIDRVANNSGENSIRIGSGTDGVDGIPFREIVGPRMSDVKFIKIDIEGSEEPIIRSILDCLPELPDDVVIASEISPGSSAHVASFVAAGFRAYAIQNVYTIDYYLIRSYLGQYGEDKSVHLTPVTRFDPQYRDYIFERAPLAPVA